MLTLTYPAHHPGSGKIVKEDVGYITTWLKRNITDEYLWFLEFQQRGAPHIHVLLTNDIILPDQRAKVGLKWVERIVTADWFLMGLGAAIDEPIGSKTYAQAYGSQVYRAAAVACHRKTWELIRDDGGARRYVTKYAAKQYQKEVPKAFEDVGRFWGCSRNVKPAGVTIDVTDEEVRQFLSENGHIAANWEVLPQYIFNVKSSDAEHIDNNQ
jgi:hypothetical protein